MKKSVAIAAASVVGLVLAVMKWFPQWARVAARLLKPLSGALKPITRTGKAVEEAVPTAAAGDGLAATPLGRTSG